MGLVIKLENRQKIRIGNDIELIFYVGKSGTGGKAWRVLIDAPKHVNIKRVAEDAEPERRAEENC